LGGFILLFKRKGFLIFLVCLEVFIIKIFLLSLGGGLGLSVLLLVLAAAEASIGISILVLRSVGGGVRKFSFQ